MCVVPAPLRFPFEQAYAYAACWSGLIPLGITMSHLCAVLRVADMLRAKSKPMSVAVEYDKRVRFAVSC